MSKRQVEGPGACAHKKNYPAGEIEGAVWGFVSGLMKDPEQIRTDLERMMEQERRSMRGDPKKKAATWLRKLTEADRKRSGFQDLAAEGLITYDELRAKLAALEEARETAERELESLKHRQRHLEGLERDKDMVLETYARMAPEALNALTPEERHRFYKMLRLRVIAYPDRPLEVSGALGDGVGVCKTEPTPSCGTCARSSGSEPLR